MKKPARILYCLVAPLHAGNILFLAKQRPARIAVPLLRLHLRIFYSLSLEQLIRHSDPAQLDLSDDITSALGCLGFIRLNNRLLNTIKSDNAIRTEASVDNKYSPGPKPVDKKLEQLIQGKTVAIVGPSKGADNQAEIDGFDFVVRMGYTGPAGFPENTGTRCDIAFYAPHKIKKMITNDSLGVTDELKLAVLFKMKGYIRRGINPDELPINQNRIAWAVLPPFKLTLANTLLKALYNCILCRPAKIKVFNADLFLSTDYPAGYIANKRSVANSGSWSYGHKGTCKSFALNHNPAEQLEFYKHYYYRGAFEADPRLTEIINMPAEQYIDKLDALYGAPLRQQLGLE